MRELRAKDEEAPGFTDTQYFTPTDVYITVEKSVRGERRKSSMPSICLAEMHHACINHLKPFQEAGSLRQHASSMTKACVNLHLSLEADHRQISQLSTTLL